MNFTTKRTIRSFHRSSSVATLIVLLLTTAVSCAAQSEINLYDFGLGSDPHAPLAGIVRDSEGNIYGTTFDGGFMSKWRCTLGCGSVFKLSPDGTFTVLHTFKALHDGANPYGTLFLDERGNLYGTTIAGGDDGNGTIFRISASGGEKVLYSFTGGADGSRPYAGVIYDHGNLYGTTVYGGTAGHGTVFELTSSGVELVLHSFAGGTGDGDGPISGLVRDSDGNLYGTTYFGGPGNFGTVFKVGATGDESVLYGFTGGSDGGNPAAGLLRGRQGELYGTTSGGGSNPHCPGCGTVFRLDPSGAETVLHTFAGGSTGASPRGGLVRDVKGTLYGTTTNGGDLSACYLGCGTIFQLSIRGFKHLYTFEGKSGNDGRNPISEMILDGEGNLYGVAQGGGPFDGGTIFEFSP